MMEGLTFVQRDDADVIEKVLETPAVILVEPQLGENIGAAARAMANFGLGHLIIVNPRDGWPNKAARASAALAVEIVDHAQIVLSLADAIRGFHFIAATSARHRFLAKPVNSPEQAMQDIVTRQERGERCCLVFGKERSGLENEDIALADLIVTAPVDARFPSLNLAQSVLLLAYEWRKCTDPDSLGRRPVHEPTQYPFKGNRPAERQEMIAFFEHLERELDKCGFLFPPQKRQTMINNIRTMFLRMAPTEQEVRTLRGIVANLRRGPWQP